MHPGRERRATRGAVLRHQPPGLVPHTTSITQCFRPERPGTPLRGLFSSTMLTFPPNRRRSSSSSSSRCSRSSSHCQHFPLSFHNLVGRGRLLAPKKLIITAQPPALLSSCAAGDFETVAAAAHKSFVVVVDVVVFAAAIAIAVRAVAVAVAIAVATGGGVFKHRDWAVVL